MNERQAHQAMDEAADWACRNRDKLRRLSCEVVQMHRPHELEQHFAPGVIDGPYEIQRPRIAWFFVTILVAVLLMLFVGMYVEVGPDVFNILMPWKG